jgi:hypothetical protein
MQDFQKKYFAAPDGKGNFDSADFALGENEWMNMENCRTKSTDAGRTNIVEGIGSTIRLSEIEPSVSKAELGAIDDPARDRFCWFSKDLYGPYDKILCYDQSDDTVYTVLQASQVTGGLNFHKFYLIHSAAILNGILYFTDELNQIRAVNIDAGIKLNHPSYDTEAVAYSAPIDPTEITLIRKPPALAPSIEKETDGTFENNFIANESFMFAFQYVWYTNEVTVLGTFSPASNLNAVTDTFNRIAVNMDANEVVPQTVRMVKLWVRIGNQAFNIKTWDKEVATEAQEIADQNDGTQVLSYDFYNDVTGEAMDNVTLLKPSDSVPITSGTLAAAKNRLFLGDNVAGYDTPLITSLGFSVTISDISGNSITRNLYSIEFRWISPVPGRSYRAWAFYISTGELSPPGWYAITSTEIFDNSITPPPLGPAPSTVAVSGLTFRGGTNASYHSGIATILGATIPTVQTYTLTANMCEITGITVDTFSIFKTKSQYSLGVVFYDFAMRKCGVVINGSLVSIPARDFAMTTAVDGIVWTLNNINAINEIPDWACYYTVVRTLNLRTRFFVQSYDKAAKYATKNSSGEYEFTNNTFVSSAVGIGLDTTALVQSGLGYVFTEGDVCILIDNSDNEYVLAVIGQSGKYIIVQTPEGGIGDLSSIQFIYEIYTPYRASEQEPYYEVGSMYRVLEPGTTARRYETLSDQLLPDAFVRTRNYDSVTYFAEAMSPNDRFYKRWDTDAGKINLVTKLGQQRKLGAVSFSNTFIPGTAVNGLSTFEALNQTDLPQENGQLERLILTSKVQDEGDVMLAICRNQTSSIYIGEVRVTDATGVTQFISASGSVIGTINTLKGSYGTINPESVVEFRGLVFWFDALNGKIIQYSANGLFPISAYNMTRYWNLFSLQYLSMTKEQIEALGDRPFVFMTVDPQHYELLVSVPKLLSVPPRGYLPDYPSMVYPFDIWDGQGKTLVYKLAEEPNYWQGAFRFVAEGFITMQNKMFSFKYGVLYQHNSTTGFNEFYGTQYKARIMTPFNKQFNTPKTYDSVKIEGNMRPSLTYLYANDPYQQSTDLMDFDYKDLEGMFYSPIYRNKLVPTASGFDTTGLLTGQKLRTPVLLALFEFTITNINLALRFVTIGYQASAGHNP